MKLGDLVRRAPALAYLLVCVGAISFDLRTDRSFGATMLATIPLAAVAITCLLVSPWVKDPLRLSLWRSWCGGALLLLVITLFFSTLGFEQARTGELILTYALLILAFPVSLAIPIIDAAVGSALPGSTVLRVILAWTVTVALAYFEWRALTRLRTVFWRRSSQAGTTD